MVRTLKIGTALSMASVMLVFMTSCTMLGSGCLEQARQEVDKLRSIVPGLLPGPVAATLQEGDGCDSGDGGYLLFTADAKTDIDRLTQPFVDRGWRRIDPSSDEISAVVIGGVTIRQGSDDVNVVISRADDPLKMDIFVEFG